MRLWHREVTQNQRFRWFLCFRPQAYTWRVGVVPCAFGTGRSHKTSVFYCLCFFGRKHMRGDWVLFLTPLAQGDHKNPVFSMVFVLSAPSICMEIGCCSLRPWHRHVAKNQRFLLVFMFSVPSIYMESAWCSLRPWHREVTQNQSFLWFLCFRPEWRASPKVCARIARAGKFVCPPARLAGRVSNPFSFFRFGARPTRGAPGPKITPGGGMCENCQGQQMQSAILALTEIFPLPSRVIDSGFQASGRVERQVS